MHRLLLLLSLVISYPAFGQSSWSVIDVGTTEDIFAFAKVTQTWMIVGTNGFAARTSIFTVDRWNIVDPGTTEDLLSVIGYRTRGFWVSGRNGAMRHSDDFGVSWQDKDLPDLTQSYVLAKGPSSGIFAFGDRDSIYVSSTPTGAWKERESGVASALHSVEVRESSLEGALIVGDEGTLLSIDWAGSTWAPKTSGTTADLHDIRRMSATEWLIVGEGGVILKSIDDGETWTPRTSGTTATLYALAGATGGQRYLAVGEDGTALESQDFGETWTSQDTGTTATLYTAVLENNGSWLVAGAGGVMLRSPGSVASESTASDTGYTLSSAWPNPVTDQSSLSLSVGRPEHVTVELVDGLGRHVQTLHDGLAAAGAPLTIRVEAGDLAPGVYVVHVRGEAFVATRQVTVTR